VSTVATVLKVSVAPHRGAKKHNVDEAVLRADHGIVGDAHAGSPRQVSLLPYESFAQVTSKGLHVEPGEFAENITTLGLGFDGAAVGDRLRIGEQVELCISQIGKLCHNGCYIRDVVGDCIMPREGGFARVVTGGRIRPGDTIVWTKTSIPRRPAHHV